MNMKTLNYKGRMVFFVFITKAGVLVSNGQTSRWIA